MKIKELEEKIIKYSQAYYLGEQIASDEEFDKLCNKLRNLDPNNAILTQVGFGIKIYGEKIKLPLEIQSSLPKIKDIKEYKSSTQSDILAPKLDGLSVLVEVTPTSYSVMTRGDGSHGVNITTKASYVPTLMTVIENVRSKFSTIHVRGEFIVRPSVFNLHYSKDYANPRNLASGIVNRKSFEGLEHIEFIPFDLTGLTEVILVGDPAYREFEKLGIKSVFDYSIYVISALYDNKRMESVYEEMKRRDLPLDGIVINGEVAWKAENISVQGEVDHIDWQLTRLGRLIPVVVLKTPVSLYGTQVSRASGFNYEFICEHTIGSGSIIKLTKANEIIPYITEVVTSGIDFTYLDKCPNCSSPTVRDGVHITCTSCYDPIKSAMVGFMETFLLPKGVQQAEVILHTLYLKTPKDLKKLFIRDEYADGLLTLAIGPHKAKLLIDHCESLKSMDTRKFLSSLSLPGVGENASEEVSHHLVEYIHSGIQSLSTKVKINTPATVSLIEHYDLVKSFYEEFINYFKKVKIVSYKAKVCVTGKLSESRKDFSNKLEDEGVQLTEKLDKDTILVTNEPTSNSSKNKKAKELGIEVISEDEARKRWLI